MKRVLLVLFISLSIVSVFAQGSKAIFDQANHAYQKGDYKKAAEDYNSILQQGYESAEVYYNLGNCYYKMNQMSLAILNYERAAKLDPDDNDITFNLKLANLKIVDRVEPLPGLFYQNWWAGLARLLPSKDWAIFTIVSLLAAALIAAVFFLISSVTGKKLSFALIILLLFFSIFSYALGNTRNKIETSHNTAIIFEPRVYVKSSPDEKSTDLFILHEGTKVKMIDEVGKWEKVQTANGNEGWIPLEAVEVI